MSGTVDPTEDQVERGFLAPRPDSKQVDHCFRCGAETPVGVGLCELHNRGHISGPSSTQMHATIFGGIAFAVIGLLVLANFAVMSSGQFASAVTATSPGPDGGLLLSFMLTNESDSRSVADCRVTRDGVPRADDFAFRTDAVPGGESVALERQLQAPPEGSVGYDAGAVTVLCI